MPLYVGHWVKLGLFYCSWASLTSWCARPWQYHHCFIHTQWSRGKGGQGRGLGRKGEGERGGRVKSGVEVDVALAL